MNTLCIQTLNHNCYCCNAILVYSWFNNLEWRREILYSLAEGCEKTEDFTFQTLAYFKYTQEKVKNEWRRNNESFEILIQVSSKLTVASIIFRIRVVPIFVTHLTWTKNITVRFTYHWSKNARWTWSHFRSISGFFGCSKFHFEKFLKNSSWNFNRSLQGDFWPLTPSSG